MAAGALQVALAGWLATATSSASRSRLVALLAMAVSILAIGRIVSWTLPGAAQSQGRSATVGAIDPQMVGMSVELAAAVALWAAAGLVVVHLQRLSGRGSFPVRSPRELGWWRRASRFVTGPRTWFALALVSSMARGRAGRTRRRLHAGLLIAIAAAAGVGPLIRLLQGSTITAGVMDALGPISLWLTFVCALSLVENVMGMAGPTALLRQLRAAWELGSSSRSLSLTLVLCLVVDGAAVGLAVALARWPLTSSFGPGPIIVGAAVAASAVLAEVLSPPRVCADESTTTSMGSATLCVFFRFPFWAWSCRQRCGMRKAPAGLDALRFDGVSAGYVEGADVLDDVSLSLSVPGVVHLLGENGCGKSTLVELASGYLAPRVGQVRVFGEPAHSAGARRRRRVCRSRPALFPP